MPVRARPQRGRFAILPPIQASSTRHRLASLLIVCAGLLGAAAGTALALGQAHHARRHSHVRRGRPHCPLGTRRVRRHGRARCASRSARRPSAPVPTGSAAPSVFAAATEAAGSSAFGPSAGTPTAPAAAGSPEPLPPAPLPPEPLPPEPAGAPLTETWQGFSASNPMPAGQTPGSAASPFNQPVASPVPLPGSAEMVAWLLSHHQPGARMPGSVEPQLGHGNPTVYAANSDPLVELVATEPWGPNALQGRRIRVPADARPADPGPPADAHLEIVLAPADARTPGETAELWRAEPPSEGKLRFAWGGPGNVAGTLLGGAATASSIDLSAGQVRAPELKAGLVPHALCASVPQTKAGFVYPASSSDGSSLEAGAPAMGQRFYLAYSDAEIAALPVAPWKQAVLRGLAHFGFYVCDSGNDTLGFEFESSVMYTAFGQPEWFSAIGEEQGLPSWEGRYVFDFAAGVDWTRLRAIPPPS
jgi:hypothetical protein